MGDRLRAGGRRLARWGLVTLVGVLLLAAIATPLLFVAPAQDAPATIRAGGRVDAVVVLGGSPQDRLDAALALAGTLPEPPPTLVLAVQYDAPLVTCGTTPRAPRLPVECFSPEPATTSGEAVWIATEAAARGWDRVVVVTSDYHVTRARILVERCLAVVGDGVTEAAYVGADTDVASLRGAWQVATEWPSLLATPTDHHAACRPAPTDGPSGGG